MGRKLPGLLGWLWPNVTGDSDWPEIIASRIVVISPLGLACDFFSVLSYEAKYDLVCGEFNFVPRKCFYSNSQLQCVYSFSPLPPFSFYF